MGRDQGQSHHNTWLLELKLIVKGIGTRYKKPVQRGPPQQQLRPRRVPGVGHNGGCPEGKSYWVPGCESTLRHPDNYIVLSPKRGRGGRISASRNANSSGFSRSLWGGRKRAKRNVLQDNVWSKNTGKSKVNKPGTKQKPLFIPTLFRKQFSYI